MSQRYIITGTDTGVGKTVFSAALMGALANAGRNVSYWKPVQSGLEGGVDTRIVQKLSGLDEARFLPETYVFSEALSLHRAAEIDGVKLDLGALTVPEIEGDLIIEGAGGLMVPLTRGNLLINQMKKWDTPVILVARTGLGTINHTLLSLEALWARDIPVHGIAFVGEANEDNMKTIAEISEEKVLGRLPIVEDLTIENLAQAFASGFDVKDF
jgi:dethiobiotin synthetase